MCRRHTWSDTPFGSLFNKPFWAKSAKTRGEIAKKRSFEVNVRTNMNELRSVEDDHHPPSRV